MNCFNWKHSESISQNCLHVWPMKNYLGIAAWKNILSSLSRKTLPFLQSDNSPRSRKISPVKSDFVSEQLFLCPLICAKKWCLGPGCQGQRDRLGSLGKEVWELPIWFCVLWYLCIVTLQSQRLFLLLLKPISGPLGILFPSPDS